MDQCTRRIIGFGVHRGIVDGVALCRMFHTVNPWIVFHIATCGGINRPIDRVEVRKVADKTGIRYSFPS